MNDRAYLTLFAGFSYAILGVAAPAQPVGTPFRTPVALTNGTIIAAPDEVIEKGTVLIENGRIVAVGTDVTIPRHAERVDATGLWIYAGFIDGQSHLGIPERTRTPVERSRVEDETANPQEGAPVETDAAARRGIRAAFRAAELYVPDEKGLIAGRGLGFTTTLLAPRDGIFSGTSDLLALSGAPIRRSLLATEVAMHTSFEIGEEGEYPRSLLGVMAQFRQALLDARWHAQMREFAAQHPSETSRVPVDANLEALLPALMGQQRVVFEANSENEIRRALALAGEFDLDLIISGGQEAYKLIDELKARRVPVIATIKFDEEPEYGRKKPKKKDALPNAKPSDDDPSERPPDESTPEEDAPERDTEESSPETDPAETASRKPSKDEAKKIYEPLGLRKERRRLWEEQVANTIRLHQAGIPFALRTRDFKQIKEFRRNLQWIIDRGLPDSAVIAALTTAPAEIFRVDGDLGRIAPGQVANLTVLSGSLSDKESKVRYLFIDGKKMEPEEEAGDSKKNAESKSEESKSLAASSKQEESGEPEDAADDPDGGPDWPIETVADRYPARRTDGNVFIRNATLLPISAPPIARGSILVREGRIVAIGPDLTPPPGVVVLNAEGRFIIPGFVDAHSHLGLDAVNEFPLTVSSEVHIADVINPHHPGLYRALAGGTTTHHIMHGSANTIGGHNATVKLRYGQPPATMIISDAPPTIKFALGENVTRANSSRGSGGRFPATRMGVEATIRTALEAALRYQSTWDKYHQATVHGRAIAPPRTDLRLAALADVLAGRTYVHAHCYRSDEILRLLQVAEDYGFRVANLQHVLEGYRIAPEIARHGAAASTFSNHWAYKVEAYYAVPHNAAMMVRQGINTSINSDSPDTIRYLGQEAAKSIKWGGLDETETLKLVTLNAAEQLFIDHRVGSLDVGKDADLAIFNGHPLNTFSKCVMTLIDGEVVFEDSRPEPVEDASTLTLPPTVGTTLPESSNQTYAIVGATVHTIAGPVIPNGTVVIANGRIHAVGENEAVPQGAGVVRGEGLHVYPGLIDAASQLGLYEIGSLRSTRDDRDVSTYSPHLMAASAIHPHSEHIRVARASGITTALAVPTGGRIYGQSAVVRLDGWTGPEMLLTDIYGLHMSVPSLPVHLPEDPEQKKKLKKDHDKAIKELEEFFARAKHYAMVRGLAASDPTIDVAIDLVLEAMIPYVNGHKPVIFTAHTYKQIVDTLEFAEKHELTCILSGARESWKLADELAKRDVAVILATPASLPANEFEPWDSVFRCAGVLHGAGVRFAFGSGSAAEAYDLGMLAGMSVAHGLPKDAAERALTLGAAEMLGVADRLGSIEVGKEADLIVTTHTPLQTVSQVTHLFMAGRPIALTNWHTEQYERFINRPAPELPPVPPLHGPPSLTR
jgi:imidazolonepropionase-like amidohydrolase